MKKITALLLSLLLIVSSLSLFVGAEKVSPFKDVKLGKWYSDAVINVYENGLMEGKGAGTFAPFENMTRAQLVTILARLADADITGCASGLTFKDTKKTSWYSDAIGWAVSEGLVTGYTDNTFKPDDSVLRQELATLFARFLEYSSISLPESDNKTAFTDATSIPKWASVAIEKMRITGIVTGDDAGRFNPAQSATRAEIAMILTRYLAALENAADPMHAKLENITSLVKLDKGKIAIDLYLYERFTDYGHINSVSEQLLPQMGLDTTVYRMVAKVDSLLTINKDTVHSHTAHSEEKEKFFIKSCTFYIENTVTGECTEEKALGFAITRHLTPETDPDSFDAGIDSKVYSEMLTKSLASTGNIARFAKAFKKTENGESITVGYIGGSITQGAISGTTRQNCWAKVSHAWLKKQFPNSDIKYVNAGIGGTCSDYGLFRSEAHLLSYNPDIIFIEFSVNDGGVADSLKQYYEALIRACLNDDNAPAVAIVISETAASESCAREYELANYYSLPVIDVDVAIDFGISSGEFTFEEFAPDGVHPYEWGHRVMADMLINMYKTVMEMSAKASDEELTVAAPPADTLTNLQFEALEYIKADDLSESERGSWKLDILEDSDNCYIGEHTGVLTANSGDTLTLKLHAKTLTILTDECSATITVNGRETSKLNGASRFCTVYTSDEATDITVVITATDASAIRGFIYN